MSTSEALLLSAHLAATLAMVGLIGTNELHWV